MRYTPIVVFTLLNLSCAPALHQNLDSPEGKQKYCSFIADTAAVGAAIKWETQHIVLQGEGATAEGWRYVAIVISEDLENVGYSKEQIEIFSKRIYSNNFVESSDHDIVSHHYYIEISCKMDLNGRDPLPLEAAIESLRKCWDKGQEMDGYVCFEKVISKEIVL